MTVASPFLPNSQHQYAFDATSLGYLKTCPRKYQYSILESWRRKSNSADLLFGGAYHSSLECYDKHRALGADHDTALYEAVQWALDDTWDYDTGKPWSSDHKTKTRETLVRSVIWYLEHFKNDPAQTLILANNKPAVELSFRFETELMASPSQPYILCGHLDRVVTWQDDIWIMDRKTTGSGLSPKFFEGFSPDNQMTLYTIAGRIAFEVPAKGVIIDAAYIQAGGTVFGRGFAHRTDSQLEEWMIDFSHWTRLAAGYAEINYWPMNETACGMYGGCPFRGICSKDPSVRPIFLESNFYKRPWNPLEPR